MGASVPPPPPKPTEISVNVYLNLPNSDSYNDFQSMAAPLANNSIKASVEAKDSENKNYNVKLNVIDNSINNNNDNTTKDYTNNEEEKNIDNNIGQNRYINNLDNNSCNLSKSNNLQENNNKETNVNENNNENKNNEDKYYEKIKENENDNNKEKNNDNNLLKEGVKNMTDFGDGQEESNESKPETNRGNEIDINMGKKDNIYNNNGITNDGEQKDINIGSDYKINEEEDDKYKGYNYSDSDLIISRIQNISDIKNITEEKTLEQSQDLLEKGLFPLFMELKDYQPLSFFVDKNMTLKTILNIYAKNMTNFDESILNGIKLFCGKCPLDINEEIQYLNL